MNTLMSVGFIFLVLASIFIQPYIKDLTQNLVYVVFAAFAWAVSSTYVFVTNQKLIDTDEVKLINIMSVIITSFVIFALYASNISIV